VVERKRQGQAAAVRALALVTLGLSLACSKGPAQEAIAAAEQALAQAPELAQHEPAELAAVSQALREARARFDEGRYTDALRIALPLQDRVAAAVQSAARRQREAEVPPP
jgi:hypothetical protein